MRLLLPRYSAENISANWHLLDGLSATAEGLGITQSQVTLAWFSVVVRVVRGCRA